MTLGVRKQPWELGNDPLQRKAVGIICFYCGYHELKVQLHSWNCPHAGPAASGSAILCKRGSHGHTDGSHGHTEGGRDHRSDQRTSANWRARDESRQGAAWLGSDTTWSF